ncbi:MAG: 16S rRNA (uracil(1498)-N(3))-methyltransferase [Hyphomonadaceae bacterium]|nr:16S rRNA (uracil(1498)-N(3))-methyltransferase [Hyphomonadaceae bacterium]TPW07677.1 MAG: 16S rRNA (uracil1498-N3)-methyltransferase [Alphaproteobacteria bacterium]
MAVPRLFVEAPLVAGAAVPLEEGQARYLTAVMRLAPGAPVRVFNGMDGEWAATLAQAGKRGASLSIGAQTRTQTAPPDLTLLFAPVKRHGTDLIVEKATELGVRTLQPVLTRRTVSETVRLERLRAIAIEAAEQTERLDVPEIAAPLPLHRILDGWDGERPLVYADEAADDPSAAWGGAQGRARPVGEALRDVRAPALALLTGPEGGFDAEERRLLRSLPYVVPVSLGPRILRAETAVIAALAVIQSSWGDW